MQTVWQSVAVLVLKDFATYTELESLVQRSGLSFFKPLMFPRENDLAVGTKFLNPQPLLALLYVKN